MKHLNVRVDFPVYFQIDVDETKSEAEVTDEIMNLADELLQSTQIEPILASCPEWPELED